MGSISKLIFPQGGLNFKVKIHFREIFCPVIPSIVSVRFITEPQYDKVLYENIGYVLRDINPKVSVKIKTTREFHDRFWIVDEKKGLFIGTSLNGLGRKYALTDFINDEDIADIVEKLKQLNLL